MQTETRQILLVVLIYRNEFDADKTLDICEMVFTGNPLTLIGYAHIDQNAKFLLTLIKNKPHDLPRLKAGFSSTDRRVGIWSSSERLWLATAKGS